MSKLKIGPGVMLSRRAGKTEAVREMKRTPAGKMFAAETALARLMEAGAKLAQYENGDFPDLRVTYKQIVAEYLAALDGAKDE